MTAPHESALNILRKVRGLSRNLIILKYHEISRLSRRGVGIARDDRENLFIFFFLSGSRVGARDDEMEVLDCARTIIMHTEILQQLGLPKNEAKIYEALLELGSANVSVIANTAKVNRRNVYDSLKNLIKRRLVSRVMGTHEQLYLPQPPEKLKDILTQERNDIISILPDLNKIYKTATPEEQIFISRGREGIKNFWNFVLSQNKTEYFVGGKGAWHDPAINEERKRLFGTTRKQGIRIQGIFDYEVSQNGIDIYSQYDETDIRFFPKGYSTKANFDICSDRLVFFAIPKERSVENATIFTIISQPLADSYRTWFWFLWKNAKRLEEIQ